MNAPASQLFRFRVPTNLQKQRHFQAVLFHQVVFGEHALRRSVGQDAAAVEHQHPLTMFDHEIQIVGGDDLAAGELAQMGK